MTTATAHADMLDPELARAQTLDEITIKFAGDSGDGIQRSEALPFKGRVWVGMVLLPAHQLIKGNTIPTPALPLKGRGKRIAAPSEPPR
jgi:hypothetical protein